MLIKERLEENNHGNKKTLSPEDRRNLTWEGCNALAESGKTPSKNLVCEWALQTYDIKLGSAGWVQGYVNDWFADLLATQRKSASGLPDDVAALARALWLRAHERAEEGLEQARIAAELDADQRAAAAESIAAKARIDAAEALARESSAIEATRTKQHELEVLSASNQATITHLKRELSTATTREAATSVSHAAALAARDERINTLTLDAKAKHDDYVARIADLDASYKRGLLEVDAARSATKQAMASSERLAAELAASTKRHQSETAAKSEEIAVMRGRLEAKAEQLSAAQISIRMLEATATKAAIDAATKRARDTAATEAKASMATSKPVKTVAKGSAPAKSSVNTRAGALRNRGDKTKL